MVSQILPYGEFYLYNRCSDPSGQMGGHYAGILCINIAAAQSAKFALLLLLLLLLLMILILLLLLFILLLNPTLLLVA